MSRCLSIFCSSLCILSVFVTLVFSQQNQLEDKNAPEWFLNPPVITEKVVAIVGAGDDKTEALINALANLSSILQSNVQTTNDQSTYVTSTISEKTFGNVKIRCMDKHYIGPVTGTGKGTEEIQNVVSKILFVDKNDSLEIKYNHEEKTVHSKTSSVKFLSSTKNNLSLFNLIQELEKSGIVIETDESKVSDYIKLTYNRE